LLKACLGACVFCFAWSLLAAVDFFQGVFVEQMTATISGLQDAVILYRHSAAVCFLR